MKRLISFQRRPHAIARLPQPRRLHTTSYSAPLIESLDNEVPKTLVLHQKISGARMFILNRPEKLNALTISMIRNISPQLKAWDVSKLSKVIIMKGMGEGRFSVGDDVLEILQKVKEKDPDSLYYFQEKSALIQMISTLSTPYVSILDGYALGGALGLFGHGPFRVATEKTIFAMPEPTLGVIFNAGASFFLPRLDGAIGTYLALTGSRIEGLDTFYAGIATHYVPSARLNALEERLIDLETSEHDIIQRVLEKFVEPVPAKRIGFGTSIRQAMDRCFQHDSLEDILRALDDEKPTSWTRETKHKLLSMSPTSLRVTLKALRKGKTMSLDQCLKMEFDLMQKFLVTKDFHEGVDATLVQKPRKKPAWQPAVLQDVPDEDIEEVYFNRPAPNTLSLPGKIGLFKLPYSRYTLPTEEDVRLAITGEGTEFGFEGRLTHPDDVLVWFEKGHRNKQGVREKVLDILQRKAYLDKDNQLQWSA